MWNLFPVSLLSYISSGIENNILETMIVSTFLALKHGACRTSIDNFLCFRSWTLAILLHLFLLKDTDIYNINYAADLPITAVGFLVSSISLSSSKNLRLTFYTFQEAIVYLQIQIRDLLLLEFLRRKAQVQKG